MIGLVATVLGAKVWQRKYEKVEPVERTNPESGKEKI